MRIGVVIDRQGLRGQLDLAALADGRWDKETLVLVADGLSASYLRALVQPNRLEALVLVGRDEERLRRMAEGALHEAGANRFALKVVNLRDLCAPVHSYDDATEKARLLLAAAIAMLRRYPWLRPANVRLRLGPANGRLSRRALLAMPLLHYEVVPSVDEKRCAAARGCNLCVAVCPAAAIHVDRAITQIQKELCRDCGLCLAECPVGAIDHPFYRRRIMDAGLVALLTAGTDARGGKIAAFACPGAMELFREAGRQGLTYPAAILPLEVPCAGFVDWYLALRAFDLGAAGVALLSCGDRCRNDCPLPEATARFQAIGVLLDAWGIGSLRLAIVAEDSAQRLVSELNVLVERVAGLPRQPLAQGSRTPIEVHRYLLARLITAIYQRLGSRASVSLADDHLPFGQVRLNGDTCSLCGLCAGRCPTRALAFVESEDGARLLFTARDCTGCGLCAEACPEAALRIERRLDLASLEGDALALKAAEMVRCQRCRHPFAPEALVRRVGAQLGDKTPSVVSSYCPDCRMVAGPFGPRP